MNKKMQKPEIEFIKFDTTDVITTSGGMDVIDQKSGNDYGGIVSGIGGFGGGIGQPLQ